MRYFIELAYKGSNYHGWQYQPNAISIQEVLSKSLSTILREEISIVGAGRTDTGVHAEEFFAHFDIAGVVDAVELVFKVNALLPNDIVVFRIMRVDDEAHARFDAISRSYEYRIILGRSPFYVETTYQIINKKLNIDNMNEAGKILLTYTNFKSFSRSNSDVKTFDCDVSKSYWTIQDQSLTFHITANRFLRNMVRAVVGTMLEVGLGKMSLEAFKDVIEGRNRSNAGPSAPAQGLFLTKVRYPNSIFINE